MVTVMVSVRVTVRMPIPQWMGRMGVISLVLYIPNRVRTIPGSAPNTQHPILWLLTIPRPNTNTGSDVIRSNINT